MTAEVQPHSCMISSDLGSAWNAIDGLPQSLRRAGATCEWQAEPSGSWDSMGGAVLEADAGRREEARERRSVRHARGS